MQERIIEEALAGRDVLAILPTGGGKSVCFQVPALMKDGLALVVTPLVALMKDQVQNLAARGIKAIAVHAGLNRHEVDLRPQQRRLRRLQIPLRPPPNASTTRLFQTLPARPPDLVHRRGRGALHLAVGL
jgi:Superfamily II DNA helicase